MIRSRLAFAALLLAALVQTPQFAVTATAKQPAAAVDPSYLNLLRWRPVGPARGGQIFLVGQLGKYVPGSVWAYILQLELGRRAGVARARVFTANVFSLAVAVVAALTVGSLAIPAVTHANPGLERLRWLYVLLPLGIIGLHPRVLSSAAGRGFRVLGRPSQDHRIRKRTVAGSLGWALASYVFFGVHVWLLTREVVVPTFENFGLTIGAMALAMISGLFFFVLPSGAGVRETVLVTALAPLVGIGRAVAYALSGGSGDRRRVASTGGVAAPDAQTNGCTPISPDRSRDRGLIGV